MDDATKKVVEEAYHETAAETLERSGNAEEAHREGIVAASMLLAAMNGMEDEEAKKAVMSLNLQPEAA